MSTKIVILMVALSAVVRATTVAQAHHGYSSSHIENGGLGDSAGKNEDSVSEHDGNADHSHEDHQGPAYYQFKYGVHDDHTGDIKDHHEHANGKEIDGSYSLKEADGTLRIVKYHTDPHHGFQAVVSRIGHATHPAKYGHDDGKHNGGDDEGHGATSYVGVTHYGNSAEH